MVAKRFGALDLIANTDTILMSGTTGFSTTLNVRFVNRTTSPVRIRLALVDEPQSTALTNLSLEDYLEYDVEIRPNGVLENTGIVIPEDYSLVVRSDSNNVTAIAFGFEEQNI